MLAENGSRVHCLSATRGEGGELGETPLCSEDELGQVRESEIVCAVGALVGWSLTFLGYQDPRMGEDEQLSEVLMITGILRQIYPGVGDRYSDPLLKTLELWPID